MRGARAKEPRNLDDVCSRYDVARNVWEFVACMAERRYRPGVATLGGRMYVLGGEEGWDRYHDTIGNTFYLLIM